MVGSIVQFRSPTIALCVSVESSCALLTVWRKSVFLPSLGALAAEDGKADIFVCHAELEAVIVNGLCA